MTSSVREKVEAILDELRRVKDIRGLAIVRRDGLLIAHTLPDDARAEKVAALSATMVGTGEIASTELDRGTFQRSLIDAEEGRFLSVGAGPLAILVGLLRKECNLGLVLLSVEGAARKLADTLIPEVTPRDA